MATLEEKVDHLIHVIGGLGVDARHPDDIAAAEAAANEDEANQPEPESVPEFEPAAEGAVPEAEAQ